MVRYYYPHESALRSLLRWQYTLTSSVFAMKEFWLYLISALVVMGLMDYGFVHLPAGVAGLDIFKLLSPQLSITIFAVVFYNNQCYSRYMSLYQTCVEIDVSAKQFVSELLIHFGDEPHLHNHIVQASKYAMAGVFYFYLSMEDVEPMTDTWNVLLEKGLLTQADKEAVRDFPGTVFTLLLHWASYIVKDAVRILRPTNGPNTYTAPELSAMSNRMYNMIDMMASSALRVRSIQNMPVPFSYFHLLNLLISSTVFATGIGCLILVEAHDAPSYCLAFLPYSVVTFVLLALRQLSGELADPFGKDDLDFPIADFMRHIYDNVVALESISLHQKCPASDHELLATCEFYKPEQIRRACQDQPEVRAKPSWSSCFPGVMAKRHSRRSLAFRLLPDEDAAKYGPRNWVTPEDFRGGERLAKWVEGFEDDTHQQGLAPAAVRLEAKADGPKAQLVGAPADLTAPAVKEKKEEVKDVRPVPSPAAPLQDAKCIDALGRIEGRMTELLTCMTELAGNLKDIAHTDGVKKKEPTRTTTVKAKAKKESSAAPAQPPVQEHEET